jgi:hypothetical protein
VFEFGDPSEFSNVSEVPSALGKEFGCTESKWLADSLEVCQVEYIYSKVCEWKLV